MRRTATVSHGTARMLKMLAPYPWEPNHDAIDIHGRRVSWDPSYDSIITAQTGWGTGVSAGDRSAIRAAAGRARTRPGSRFADPGYRRDGRPRYPIDTERRVRAAWGYINQAGNARRYTAAQLAHIHRAIQAAGRRYGITFGHARTRRLRAAR